MKAFIFLFVFLLPLSSLADSPRCYLHGKFVPRLNESVKPKLDDNLRMRFDADEQSKCELMIKSYCKYHVLKEQYLPSKLEAFYKDETGKKTTYSFGDTCSLTRIDH